MSKKLAILNVCMCGVCLSDSSTINACGQLQTRVGACR
jgi:hypothetical protein